MIMINFSLTILLAFASYAVTVVIASSDIMRNFRRAFRSAVGLLKWPLFVRFYETADGLSPILEDEHDIDAEIETIIGGDFISCRLCTGFWVTLAICLCNAVYSVTDILAVYGLGYFLVKLERF